MKKLFCVLLAVAMVLCLAACGSEDIVGTYEFQKVVINGEEYSAAESAEVFGVETIVLEITGDGTAIMTVDGETEEMAFDAAHIWVVDVPEEKVEFSVKNGTATVMMGIAKVYLAKKPG